MHVKHNRWCYALNSNSNRESGKYPFQSSEAWPQPLNTRLKYIYIYLFEFFYWLSAAVTEAKSHDEGGVAKRYQSLFVSLTTANPVLIDSSQHHQFFTFAEAQLRTRSGVVTQRPYRPEDRRQRSSQLQWSPQTTYDTNPGWVTMQCWWWITNYSLSQTKKTTGAFLVLTTPTGALGWESGEKSFFF